MTYAPVRKEGGVIDPDEFEWDCGCEKCSAMYGEWKAAYDAEQKEKSS